MTIDTEDVGCKKVFAGEHEAVYYTKRTLQTVVWHDDQYMYEIICETSIAYDELMALAESVVPASTTDTTK